MPRGNVDERSPTSMAGRLFRFLNHREVRYAALGDVRRSVDEVERDVDLVVDSTTAERLPRLVWDFCHGDRVQLVQVLKHEQSAWYFVLTWRDDEGRLRSLGLDFCVDFIRDGRLLLRAHELLVDRKRSPEDWFEPAPAMAFIYYLTKRVDKDALGEDNTRYLTATWREDEKGASRQVQRFWSAERAKWICDAATSGDWRHVIANLPQVRTELRARLPRDVGHVTGEVRRVVERVLRPTGLCIALLGPDGSGKSTLARRLTQSLSPAFRRSEAIHFRPRIGGHRPLALPQAPCRDRPRGAVPSFVKLIYYWAEYVLGFSTDVTPKLVKSTLVVFDRYYSDLYVDPIRYRYGGPAWLARLVGRAIPQPAILVVLDAPAELLTSRKGELSGEEAHQQAKAYRNMAQKEPRYRLVDASLPVEGCAAATERIVLDFLERRTCRRLGLPDPLRNGGADRDTL